LIRSKSLAKVRTFVVREFVYRAVRWYYTKIWGMTIGEGTRISLTAKLDMTNPRGLTIGDYTAVAFGSSILSHDFVNSVHLDTKIGSCCFIGGRAIIMPGVVVGDHCIIGAGAVVMRNVPPGSVVVGNPGRITETDIETGQFGARIRKKEAS